MDSKRKVLFIPDIDKWKLWYMELADVIAAGDIAFILVLFPVLKKYLTEI